MGVGGSQPQPAGGSRVLQRCAEAEVEIVGLDVDAGRAVLAGHQDRRKLDVPSGSRSLGAVAEADLDARGVKFRRVPDAAKQAEHRRVVAQVLTDAGKLVDNRNAHFPEVIGRPDARQHQDLRRGDGAGAEDNLVAVRLEYLAAALRLDADGRLIVKEHSAGHHVAPHGQVEPMPGHGQVR